MHHVSELARVIAVLVGVPVFGIGMWTSRRWWYRPGDDDDDRRYRSEDSGGKSLSYVSTNVSSPRDGVGGLPREGE